MVLDFLRERIGELSEAAHTHAHGEVATLDAGLADVCWARPAFNAWPLPNAHWLGPVCIDPTEDTAYIWTMTNLQIQSVRSPFDNPRLASVAIETLTRADAMGLLLRPVTCLDYSAIQGLETGMAEAGIGRRFLAELHRMPCSDAARLSTLLEKINEAFDQSPAPAHEWCALESVLGVEMLTRLLGISRSSARRYISGDRSTPDAIAARLHFLAFVAGDLGGAYNDIGVRRWFDRPRERLGGDTPSQALGDAWSPEEDGPRRVRDLARALASSPAT